MNAQLASVARTLVLFAMSLTPVTAAAGALVLVPGDAHAINTCKRVDIKVTNSHVTKLPIKVRYIEYQVNGAGDWYKEDLANTVLNPGVQTTWNNQNLQNLPEGSTAKFRVTYKLKLTDGMIPKFSDDRHAYFDRLSDKCNDGQSYSFTIE